MIVLFQLDLLLSLNSFMDLLSTSIKILNLDKHELEKENYAYCKFEFSLNMKNEVVGAMLKTKFTTLRTQPVSITIIAFLLLA
jgi:hypothetical protein